MAGGLWCFAPGHLVSNGLAYASALSWQVGRSGRFWSGRTQLAPGGQQAAIGRVRGLRENRSPQSSVSEPALLSLFSVLLAKASHNFGPASLGGGKKIYLLIKRTQRHTAKNKERGRGGEFGNIFAIYLRRLNGFFGRSFSWDGLELKQKCVLLGETIYPLKAVCVFLFKGIRTFQQGWGIKKSIDI